MGGIDIILKWQFFMAARVAHKKKNKFGGSVYHLPFGYKQAFGHSLSRFCQVLDTSMPLQKDYELENMWRQTHFRPISEAF